jgi:hypothetical protein
VPSTLRSMQAPHVMPRSQQPDSSIICIAVLRCWSSLELFSLCSCLRSKWSYVTLGLAALQVALGVSLVYVSLAPATQVAHLTIASLCLVRRPFCCSVRVTWRTREGGRRPGEGRSFEVGTSSEVIAETPSGQTLNGPSFQAVLDGDAPDV